MTAACALRDCTATIANPNPELGVALAVADAALVPTALVAVAEQVYVTPFVRPDTVRGEPVPDAMNAPGLQVTA